MKEECKNKAEEKDSHFESQIDIFNKINKLIFIDKKYFFRF